MKIAIVGSRDFPKLELVDAYILQLPPDTIIISGGARGVDKRAETVARLRGLSVKIFYPDWDKYGKKAGFLRNQQIIAEADEVVAFWDGISKGTSHSIELARKSKKNVTIVNP